LIPLIVTFPISSLAGRRTHTFTQWCHPLGRRR
jgi:hypothetical protein